MKNRILVFLLIFIELFAMCFGLLKSINLFLILLIWFNWLYNIYGLSYAEEKLRAKFPIKVSFSMIIRLILRSIKIKYIIVKLLLRELKEKNLGIKDFIIFITIMGITIIIFRYLRGALIVEVIEVFEINKKLIKYYEVLIGISSIIIVDIVNSIRVQISVRIADLLKSIIELMIKDLLYDLNIIETKPNWVLMMKKAKEIAMKRGPTSFELSGFSNILTKKPISIAEINQKIEITNDGKISKIKDITQEKGKRYRIFFDKYITDKLTQLAIPINKTWFILNSNQGFERHNINNTGALERLINQSTPAQQYNELVKNHYNIFQNCRIICYPYKNVSGLRIKNESDRVIITNIYLHIRDELGLAQFCNNPVVQAQHLLYEIPFIPVLGRFYNNYNIQWLEAQYKPEEADLLLIPKNDVSEYIKKVQLKARTDFAKGMSLLEQFYTKYKHTDMFVVYTYNKLFIYERFWDNPFDYENRNSIQEQKTVLHLTNKNMDLYKSQEYNYTERKIIWADYSKYLDMVINDIKKVAQGHVKNVRSVVHLPTIHYIDRGTHFERIDGWLINFDLENERRFK